MRERRFPEFLIHFISNAPLIKTDSIRIHPRAFSRRGEGQFVLPETAFKADPTQSAGFKAKRPADDPDANLHSQNM